MIEGSDTKMGAFRKIEAERDSARVQRDVFKTERDVARAERDAFEAERDFAFSEVDVAGKRIDNLEANDVAREEYVAAVSHDLKNPIAAIKMAAQLLRSRLLHDDEARKMITLIERNADFGAELIDTLLEVDLVESGRELPINASQCNLCNVVAECLHDLNSRAKHRTRFDYHDEISGLWDKSYLKRAIKNLIENAMKYGDPDREIIVKCDQTSETASISVRNFGVTIPLDVQRKIFERRFRVDTRNQGLKGLGLGLALVRGVVAAHKGKVEVSSSETEGTLFTVTLPKT